MTFGSTSNTSNNTKYNRYDLQKFYEEKPVRGRRRFPEVNAGIFDVDKVGGLILEAGGAGEA